MKWNLDTPFCFHSERYIYEVGTGEKFVLNWNLDLFVTCRHTWKPPAPIEFEGLPGGWGLHNIYLIWYVYVFQRQPRYDLGGT